MKTLYSMKINKDQNFILPCSLIFFIAFYSLSVYWFHCGYFSEFDLLFDADPNIILESFTRGYVGHGWGRQALSHPFLEVFSLPVILIAKVFSTLLNTQDTLSLKKIIALAISPLFSSLTIYYFYKTLNFLKLKRTDAIIFCLFFCVSTTNIIFASIPETYAISGFLISYLIFSFYNAKVNNVFLSNRQWFIIATVITGITITNICIFFLVYTLHLLRNCKLNWRVAFKKAVIISISALILIILYYFLSHLILNLHLGHDGRTGYIKKYTTVSFQWFIRSLLNLLSGSINALIAIFPESREHMNTQHSALNPITFQRDSSNFMILASSVFFWVAFIYYSRKEIIGEKWRDLYFITLLIIAYNFSLHSIFGAEPFLYSSHWILPLILLFVPILKDRQWISGSLLAVISTVNVYFLFQVNDIVMFGN